MGWNLRNYYPSKRLYAALLPNSQGRMMAAGIAKSPIKTHRKPSFFREDVEGALDVAGETTLMIRRLLLLLGVAAFAVPGGGALAQGAFPAPLPGQARLANDPAFPPVNGAAPSASIGAPRASFPLNGAAPFAGAGFQPAPAAGPQAGPDDQCMKAFLPLRDDTEKRGKMIKTASEHHATPQEACKLFGNFVQAEIKMIKYVESHATKCGIPPNVAEQMKASHKAAESTQQKVCAIAEQQQKGPPGPSLSEVLGSSAALPEATAKKKGGSTFDTLNGNVLTR
jgi:hypothetical protein